VDRNPRGRLVKRIASRPSQPGSRELWIKYLVRAAKKGHFAMQRCTRRPHGRFISFTPVNPVFYVENLSGSFVAPFRPALGGGLCAESLTKDMSRGVVYYSPILFCVGLQKRHFGLRPVSRFTYHCSLLWPSVQRPQKGLDLWLLHIHTVATHGRSRARSMDKVPVTSEKKGIRNANFLHAYVGTDDFCQ
jgi:hypothetical protein